MWRKDNNSQNALGKKSTVPKGAPFQRFLIVETNMYNLSTKVYLLKGFHHNIPSEGVLLLLFLINIDF